MYVNPVASKPATMAESTSTSTTSTLPNEDTTQTFLTLLMTQLKTQDPLSPMDPTQMVTQLVQFNSLGQLMSIRQLLEQQTGQNQSTTAASAVAGGR